MRKTLIIALIAAAVLIPGAGRSAPVEEGSEQHTYYYGLEINDVVCGYITYDISIPTAGTGGETILKEYMFARLSALGSSFDSELWLTYRIDPSSWQFIYHDSRILQADLDMSQEIVVKNGFATAISNLSDNQESVEIPPGTILENTLFFPHLKSDFVDKKEESVTYDIYEVREQCIQQSKYTMKGFETLDLAGKTFESFHLEELNFVSGLKIDWWIDVDTGMFLKVHVPGNRKVFLSDRSVMKDIKLADLNESIMTRTNESIGDIHSISSMKVKAVMQPSGTWVTVEGLNLAGQKFVGTVDENRIEGIFEIAHIPYDGSDAPAFPSDLKDDTKLRDYLLSDELIESEDPDLIRRAEELTEGSADSWEAAKRLCLWVADSIRYEIPGGMTSRKTYDCRCGECGAHSILLSAFCRSVGIPARVVWGCMYAPNFGGSFGQHAWNEIYMGEAGWIPVDATTREIDFVDSGHIRIGEYRAATTAINMEKMEILEFSLTGDSEEETGGLTALQNQKYGGLIGKYSGPHGNQFEILVENGGLSVDIPGRMLLALEDADDSGRHFAKLTNKVFVTFESDSADSATAMAIHELIDMPRSSPPDSIDPAVPEEYLPYMGKFTLKALQAVFTIFFDNGSIAVNDPLNGIVIHLKPTGEKDRFIDEMDRNYISFIGADSGPVESIQLESVNRFTR